MDGGGGLTGGIVKRKRYAGPLWNFEHADPGAGSRGIIDCFGHTLGRGLKYRTTLASNNPLQGDDIGPLLFTPRLVLAGTVSATCGIAHAKENSFVVEGGFLNASGGVVI